MFLTKFLNPVIQDAAKFFGKDWSNIALDIAKSYPTSFAGDLDIKTVLTTDEQRAELGFQPLEKVTPETELQPLPEEPIMASIKAQDSYTDYPKEAINNAKRALKYAEENGWGSCLEASGKQRANQLAKGEPISRDTIARMASFKRHQQHKNVPYSEGCGGLAWDAWGGDAGIEWAINKLKEIDSK
jgi:hypothetical protein